MSAPLLDWVWEHSPHNDSDLLVLLAIASCYGEYGIPEYEFDGLAGRCRMSIDEARFRVTRLARVGALSVSHDPDGYHRWTIRVTEQP